MIGPFCSPFPRNSCSSSPPPPAADVVIAISFSLESNNCERAGGMAVAQLIIVFFFFFHCSCRPTTDRAFRQRASFVASSTRLARKEPRARECEGGSEGGSGETNQTMLSLCVRLTRDCERASALLSSPLLPHFQESIFRRASARPPSFPSLPSSFIHSRASVLGLSVSRGACCFSPSARAAIARELLSLCPPDLRPPHDDRRCFFSHFRPT